MDKVNVNAILFSSTDSKLCLAVTILLLLWYIYVYRVNQIKYRLPLGPLGLPFFGNLFQMWPNPHLKLSQWANKYGKLFTVSIAGKKVLVVSDVDWQKQLFGSMASTGKYKTESFLVLTQGQYGIANTEGYIWSEQRQFCMRSLKDLGFGRSCSMEPLILNEAHALCEWIRRESQQCSKKSVDLEHVMSQATINSLWTFVTGERFSFEDSKIVAMWDDIISAMQYSLRTGLVAMPWLKYIFPKLSGYVALDKAAKRIHSFVEEKFKQRCSAQVEGEATNLIDAYISHMKTVNDIGGQGQNSFLGEVGWANSVGAVVELFFAGGETMSSTMRWAVVFLSHYPDAAQKLQAEIDEVVGRDRDPSLMDKTRMPYAEAVIWETLRMSSVVPMGVPHELLEDVPVNGYTLPKGLLLLTNSYHIHRIPEIWRDPENFRPERFLEDNGEGQRLRANVMAFQPGKRVCLGAPLAMDVLFLFITTLAQQFRFEPSSEISKEDYFNPNAGIFLLPRCSEFVITPR